VIDRDKRPRHCLFLWHRYSKPAFRIVDGRFNRLFNALLSADHSSQIFGVPESYEPIFHDLNPSKDIDYSNLKPNHYYSYGINVIDTESDVRASK